MAIENPPQSAAVRLRRLLPPLLATLIALVPLVSQAADPTPDELRARAAVLIKQLASEQYIERRAAQNELAEIGLIAFDQLSRAREHSDPEVAAAAERLLAGITVYWIRPHDTPGVRDNLERYGQLDQQRRISVVRELRRLRGYDGLDALARIVRYDLSEKVSARAAIETVDLAAKDTSRFSNREPSPSVPEEGLESLREVLAEQSRLYGESQRRGVLWLQLFLEQQDEPRAALRQWRQELEEVRNRTTRGVAKIDESTLEGLTWNLLRVELLAGEQEAAVKTAMQLVTADTRRPTVTLDTALKWMIAAGADEAIDQVLASNDDLPLLTTKNGLYLAARTRARQGKKEQADELAQQALGLEAEPGLQAGRTIQGRLAAGRALELEGYADWAIAEYAQQIDDAGVLSPEGVVAARFMAETLHDAAQYSRAQEVLAAVLQEVNASPENKGIYKETIGDLVALSEITGLEAYNRALASSEAGDTAAERAALLEAIENEPDNADVLIAMYRASAPDEPYHQDALERIGRVAAEYEKQIDQQPEQYVYYNYYAWLISNTEGDFEKAVRYSQQSLLLKPDTPEFLDTLARCYYAAGELEKAVQTQREAIRGLPHMQVMQRQLRFFEEKLAEQAP